MNIIKRILSHLHTKKQHEEITIEQLQKDLKKYKHNRDLVQLFELQIFLLQKINEYKLEDLKK